MILFADATLYLVPNFFSRGECLFVRQSGKDLSMSVLFTIEVMSSTELNEMLVGFSSTHYESADSEKNEFFLGEGGCYMEEPSPNDPSVEFRSMQRRMVFKEGTSLVGEMVIELQKL